MQLVWSSTGDTINIVVEDLRVINYWVDRLDLSNKNSFEFIQSTFPDKNLIDTLSSNVKDINDLLIKFNIDPLIDHTVDWLNQDNLNVAHEKWVKLHHTHKIVELLAKFKGSVLQKFHDINSLIHKIERPISIKYDNNIINAWQVTNPFGADILKFGTWQVELHYQNLGRSTYEKWVNFDKNIVDTDTNNFTHFGGRVCFNLGMPYSSQAPQEYITYCSDNTITPYGSKLPIGNFTESITTLRHLFNKNVGIENNRIYFMI